MVNLYFFLSVIAVVVMAAVWLEWRIKAEQQRHERVLRDAMQWFAQWKDDASCLVGAHEKWRKEAHDLMQQIQQSNMLLIEKGYES